MSPSSAESLLRPDERRAAHGSPAAGPTSAESESSMPSDGAQEGVGCCCGLSCKPSTWVQWRQASGRRDVWRAMSSAMLVLNVAGYMWLVGPGDPFRLAAGAVFLTKCMIAIWGQSTPTWMAPQNPILFVVIFFTGLPGVLYMYARCSLVRDLEFPGSRCVGMALYLFGSAYSLSYEMHRFRWKARSENKGRLHTVAHAAYCIHPNYFGDLSTYSGWALLTGTWCAMSIPITTVWVFTWLVIPNSDKYLAERYPKEFPAYAAATATLIPFVHSSVLKNSLALAAFIAANYVQLFMCSSVCGWA